MAGSDRDQSTWQRTNQDWETRVKVWQRLVLGDTIRQIERWLQENPPVLDRGTIGRIRDELPRLPDYLVDKLPREVRDYRMTLLQEPPASVSSDTRPHGLPSATPDWMLPFLPGVKAGDPLPQEGPFSWPTLAHLDKLSPSQYQQLKDYLVWRGERPEDVDWKLQQKAKEVTPMPFSGLGPTGVSQPVAKDLSTSRAVREPGFDTSLGRPIPAQPLLTLVVVSHKVDAGEDMLGDWHRSLSVQVEAHARLYVNVLGCDLLIGEQRVKESVSRGREILGKDTWRLDFSIPEWVRPGTYTVAVGAVIPGDKRAFTRGFERIFQARDPRQVDVNSFLQQYKDRIVCTDDFAISIEPIVVDPKRQARLRKRFYANNMGFGH